MMSIFLPSGLANVPKFSREQRMPISICFCRLRISEYILLIEPFTPDFTSKRQSYKWMFRDKRQSYEGVFYDKRQSYKGAFYDKRQSYEGAFYDKRQSYNGVFVTDFQSKLQETEERGIVSCISFLLWALMLSQDDNVIKFPQGFKSFKSCIAHFIRNDKGKMAKTYGYR